MQKKESKEIVPKGNMEVKPDRPAPKFFEFGDVFFECNRCGNYERFQKGVKDGMQFVLPTSDQHEWRLVCPKCENMMRIFFKESDEATIVEAKEQLKLKEEADRKKAEDEALEKAKNESNKEDKEKGSSKGNDTDSKRSNKSDGKGKSTPPTSD